MAFSKQEELRLIELVRENNDKLFGTGLVPNGSSVRKQAWVDITTNLNSESSVRRTTEQVKKKWYNMKSTAKTKNADIKRTVATTGGGPPPVGLTDPENAIIDFLGGTPSFSGVDGFDSQVTGDDSVLREISDFVKENNDSSTPIRKRRRIRVNKDSEIDVKPLQIEVLQLQKENAILQKENALLQKDALQKFIRLLDRVSEHPFLSS